MVILEESMSIDDRWVPKPRVSVLACIPAYNAEATIAKVLVKARDRVSRMIVCDDYSSDMTSQIASAFGAIVLKHDASMGYNATLATLLDFARGTDADIIVTLDADGSHDPADITRIIEPISSGTADIVIGSRFVEDSNAPIELVEEKPRKNSANGRVRDPASGFRAYSRRALKLILPIERDALIKTKILEKAKNANLRVIEVPIEMGEKKEAPAPAAPLAKVNTAVEKESASWFESLRNYAMGHSILVFGTPGLVILVIGTAFGLLAAQAYLRGVTSIPLIVMGAGGLFLGFLLLAIMVIVWVLVGAVNRQQVTPVK
jgi:glycosyltransferase involved in cell wall biosynthesis